MITLTDRREVSVSNRYPFEALWTVFELSSRTVEEGALWWNERRETTWEKFNLLTSLKKLPALSRSRGIELSFSRVLGSLQAADEMAARQ